MYIKYIYLHTYIICIYYIEAPIYLYKEGEEWEEGDETLITWGERWLGERRSGDGVWRDTPRKKLDRLKGKDGGVAFKFIQRAGV